MAVSPAPPPPDRAALPPQNDDAERGVLGSILLTEQALDGVLLEIGLRASDFYRPRHQAIFETMIRLKEKAEPEAVDVLTVCDDLRRQGQIEEVGGEDYVHSLPSTVPAVGNVFHYARIVKDHATLRRLLDATRKIQQEVLSSPGEPRELVERAEAELFRIGHDEHAGEVRHLEAVLHDEIDKLEELSRKGIRLTGTPSGFKDLDDVTGGFQPGNLIVVAARPSMGKCLTGDALVYDPTTGARRRIDSVVEAVERGEEATVAALGPDLRLRPQRVSAAFRNGRRPVFRLTTKLGRQIDATENHPLFTLGGWKPLAKLAPGDRIGVPRSLPKPDISDSMPDHEIVLLAALIADGSLTGTSPRFAFGPDSQMLPIVEHAAAATGCRLTGRIHGTTTISRGRGSGGNPVTDLCRQHGIWGKLSGEKSVPDAIFGLGDEQIARFLAVLFGCDGYVHVSDRLRHVGYTTICRELASDVQHLLLRLGITSTIRTLRREVYEGTDTTALEVRVTDQASLAVFCARIPVCGKEDRLERLWRGLETAQRLTLGDTFPAEAWDEVLTAKGSRPWATVSVATGRPRNHNWHVRTRNLSRRLMVELAEAIPDDRLSHLAESDLWWDQVASIEPIGEAETFDLTVPDGHNFVANDVLVHNSTLATNMLENAAIQHGSPVVLFSLEMSEAELAQRFIASQAKVSSDDLRKGQVKAAWPKVVKAAEKLAGAPIYVDDSSDIGILEIRAKARRLHARHNLGLIIVDYLQLMRAEDGRDSRVEQVGKMSRGLKILARELNVPVIAVSQLSRAVESRTPSIPMLSDLRESGQIEQDADVVMFVYRDEVYTKGESERPGEADVIIAKHRNGPLATVGLAFQSRYPKFTGVWRDPSRGAAVADAGPEPEIETG